MIDELDLLKKDWKRNENSFTQVSEQEIYKMIRKRSSSIVKWILIISIAEVLFWSLLNVVFVDENYFKTLEMYHLSSFFKVFTVVGYVVIFGFIYLFYKNFKTISATDTVQQLMRSIIKTRKAVQYYVWYNLAMLAFTFVLVAVFQVMYDPTINDAIQRASNGAHPDKIWWIIGISYTLLFLLLFGFFWIFYRIIYGFFMKRLLSNYKELQKLDF